MYICPVCQKRLKKNEKSWVCPNRHSFDIARKGYVNLLTTDGKNPGTAGDNADMVRARTAFLDKGYYLPLADRISLVIFDEFAGVKSPVIIDSGCGEGFYTVCYAKHIQRAKFFGIDISKNAVAHCMTRVHLQDIHNCEFAVASSFKLPFEDGFADAIVCTFAPVSNDSYAAKLKDKGRLIVVSPSPRHLFELKAVVYDEPYENKPNVYGLNKFRLKDEQIYEYKAHLASQEDIFSLFMMTPYYYKTSTDGLARLKALDEIEVTCGFVIQTYEKL